MVTAKSSAEAEKRAMAHGCCELLWLRILLEELGFKQGDPMDPYSDSISAIKLANYLVYHDKTNHVEIDCHFSREKIEKEDVLLLQVHTEDRLADFLTKAVNKAKLHHVWSKLGIVSIYEPA